MDAQQQPQHEWGGGGEMGSGAYSPGYEHKPTLRHNKAPSVDCTNAYLILLGQLQSHHAAGVIVVVINRPNQFFRSAHVCVCTSE